MQAWCVVTCKGRRKFIEQTAPTIIRQRAAGYCLVDFACPEGSADWLEAEFHGSPNVVAERCSTTGSFHKTRANNAGAARVRELGARWVLFADADTLFAPRCLETILGLLDHTTFLVAGRTPDDRCIRSLTGFIALSMENFQRSGGFDEKFRDWGAEDIEYRLRLFFELGLEPVELPYGSIVPIDHEDALRTAFYEQRSLAASSARNNAQLLTKLKTWSGKGFAEQTGTAARLLFGQY